MMRLKKHSISEITRYSLGRLLKTEWYKLYYLVRELNEDVFENEVELDGIKIRELSYDDFLNGDPNVFKGEKLELYKRRFKDPTYKAFGIKNGDMLLYSTWISLYKLGLPIESKPVLLNSSEGYIEDSYCRPEARGRGYHTLMNMYCLRQLHRLGKRTAIVTVISNNIPAIKGDQRAGFQIKGSFFIGRFLGREFNTLTRKSMDNFLK